METETITEIYCSPRCGRGCTRQEYDAAVAAAHDVALRLGDGWQPYIWENFGWHWSVRKGCAEIMKLGKSKRYTAWLNFRTGGDHLMQISEHAKTPEDALGFAVQNANGVISIIRSSLDQIAEAPATDGSA